MSFLRLLGLDVKKWNAVAEESRKLADECRTIALQIEVLLPKVEKVIEKANRIADIVLEEDTEPNPE